MGSSFKGCFEIAQCSEFIKSSDCFLVKRTQLHANHTLHLVQELINIEIFSEE